jgi:hypothetical protein
MSAALSRHGYTSVTITTVTISVRYVSPDQWWQASLSEGPWLCWQHIPRDQLPAARADALQLLETLREPDGTLTRHIPTAYAVATTATPEDR